MDERKIEVLIAAIEEGSLNRAAQRCFCSQSAVTQLVRSLEDELGCKVLERSHAGVSLTEEGKALLPALRDAHGALRHVRAVADRLSGDGGRVRVGTYASIAASWLPEAMAEFALGNPDASFSMRIGSRELASLLREEDADVILCDDWLFEGEFAANGAWDFRAAPQVTGPDGVTWTFLADDPLLAVAPSSLGYKNGQTVARSELFEHPFVFNPDYVFSHYLTSKVKSLVKVSSADSSAVLSMVASGLGISVLPQLALRSVPDGVAVLNLDPPGNRMLGAVTGSGAKRTALDFVRFLALKFGKRTSRNVPLISYPS